MTITFNVYATLLTMIFVLLLGRFLINRSKFLHDYNIPEPVVGGILVAFLIFLLYTYGNITFQFDGSLKDPLMLTFFTSIGLSADFASLKKGGKLLLGFLLIVVGLLFLQNIVGIGVAKLLGVDPIIGLLGGSITMSGGHGTGAAWAEIFKNAPYHFGAATEVAIASATFGLVMGGIIGGPVAYYLVKKHKLTLPNAQQGEQDIPTGFEKPQQKRLITASSFVESLALIAIALFVGIELSEWSKSFLTLPTFVWCLFIGVVLRNLLQATKIHQVFDREVSVIGNVSLSLFLAFALVSINLWQLVSLALPMLIILICQVTAMVLYAIFITFRFCGKDYDAAVLAAGHCGFGLGATPTAIANLQTVTQHYGPSHMAFVVVPLVGAFFIDIINAIIISGTLKLPLF